MCKMRLRLEGIRLDGIMMMLKHEVSLEQFIKRLILIVALKVDISLSS